MGQQQLLAPGAGVQEAVHEAVLGIYIYFFQMFSINLVLFSYRSSQAGPPSSPGRVIPITEAHSRNNPLPPDIAGASREVFLLYIENRRQEIRENNRRVERAVRDRTARLREEAGRGNRIVCPDCGEEQSWGELWHTVQSIANQNEFDF